MSKGQCCHTQSLLVTTSHLRERVEDAHSSLLTCVATYENMYFQEEKTLLKKSTRLCCDAPSMRVHDMTQ